MLNPIQAERIVKACIHALSGQQAQDDDKLKDVGFPNSDRVDQLRDLIVNDPTDGVPSFNHDIDPNQLAGMGPNSEVGDVAIMVQENASSRAL